MCNDPQTKQNINYATPIYFENNPQNVMALDLDKDEHYEPTPKLYYQLLFAFSTKPSPICNRSK